MRLESAIFEYLVKKNKNIQDASFTVEQVTTSGINSIIFVIQNERTKLFFFDLRIACSELK